MWFYFAISYVHMIYKLNFKYTDDTFVDASPLKCIKICWCMISSPKWGSILNKNIIIHRIKFVRLRKYVLTADFMIIKYIF